MWKIPLTMRWSKVLLKRTEKVYGISGGCESRLKFYETNNETISVEKKTLISLKSMIDN